MLARNAVKTWYLIHKWSSLICTAFLLVLCITGLPLIFREEIHQLSDRHIAPAATPAGAKTAALDALLATAKRYHHGESVQFLSWDDDEPRVLISLLRPGATAAARHILSFDAHSGALLEEEPSESSSWLDRAMMFVTLVHMQLNAGLWGGFFLGMMGAAFVIALISGVIVYGPFMRRMRFGTVRRAQGVRTMWFDVHNLFGVVVLVWMAVVALTGMINTLAVPMFGQWAARALPALLAPYRGLPLPKALSSVDAAVAAAHRAVPGSTFAGMVFPTDPSPADIKSPRHYIIWSHGDSTLTKELFTPILIDAQNGRISSAEGLPAYLRALELSRPLHFGDYGGLPLKVLWAALDLMTITVLVSGVYLTLSRHKGPIDSRLAAVIRAQSTEWLPEPVNS